MDREDRGSIVATRPVDEDGCEPALADLLGRKLSDVVCGCNDEHSRVRLRQPAEQRAGDAAGRAAVSPGGRLHAANRFS